MVNMELLENACRIHTSHMMHRYLMACAHGRWDGFEKATRHKELCSFYVAVVRGGDPDTIRRTHESDYQNVHTTTQQLTDNMDTQIGFPLDSKPDYDVLVPRFFARFHQLALFALGVDT